MNFFHIKSQLKQLSIQEDVTPRMAMLLDWNSEIWELLRINPRNCTAVAITLSIRTESFEDGTLWCLRETTSYVINKYSTYDIRHEGCGLSKSPIEC